MVANVQFGFSVVGVVFLLMLFVPNIVWARRRPPGYDELEKGESRVLLAFERVGQVATSCSAVVFVCPQGFDMPWLLWLVAAFVLMLLYELAWARYFVRGRRLPDMYAPLGPIPMPLATLPVAAFFLLGVWCMSPVTVVSAVVLGIGHIGIHLRNARETGSL